jgi:hypothetical protein
MIEDKLGDNIITNTPIKIEFMSQVNLKHVCDSLGIRNIEGE